MDGVLNVWVGPADNPAAAKPVTTDQGRGIRFYGWAYTNNHIGYIQDRDGDENWHLYHVDLTTGETMDMTPLENVQARMQQVSPKYPEEALVLLNARNPQFHEIYRVNIYTGERELVQENDQFGRLRNGRGFQRPFRRAANTRRGQRIVEQGRRRRMGAVCQD